MRAARWRWLSGGEEKPRAQPEGGVRRAHRGLRGTVPRGCEEQSACVPPVAAWGRGRSAVPLATLTCWTRPWLLYFSRDPSPSLGIDNSRNCWKTACQATCGPGADGGCAGRAESRRDHRDLMHVPHGGPGLLMAIPVNSENVARSVSPKPVSCTKGPVPCRAAVSPVWRQRRHPGVPLCPLQGRPHPAPAKMAPGSSAGSWAAPPSGSGGCGGPGSGFLS